MKDFASMGLEHRVVSILLPDCKGTGSPNTRNLPTAGHPRAYLGTDPKLNLLAGSPGEPHVPDRMGCNRLGLDGWVDADPRGPGTCGFAVL